MAEKLGRWGQQGAMATCDGRGVPMCAQGKMNSDAHVYNNPTSSPDIEDLDQIKGPEVKLRQKKILRETEDFDLMPDAKVKKLKRTSRTLLN